MGFTFGSAQISFLRSSRLLHAAGPQILVFSGIRRPKPSSDVPAAAPPTANHKHPSIFDLHVSRPEETPSLELEPFRSGTRARAGVRGDGRRGAEYSECSGIRLLESSRESRRKRVFRRQFSRLDEADDPFVRRGLRAVRGMDCNCNSCLYACLDAALIGDGHTQEPAMVSILASSPFRIILTV